MSKELHPICFYINDREEMLNQMFSTMKEDKFRAMLPPILKGMEVEELKKCCLEELLGMSSKRIHSIVAGRELLSSSDSEDLELSASENEESPSAEDSDSDSSANCPPKSRRVSKDARTDDTLQIAISSEEMGDLLKDPRASAPVSRKHNADKLKRPHKRTELIVKPKKSKHPQQVAEVNGQVGIAAAQPEKTLLEMLELELRARAIRAALTHQEKINLLDNRVVADTGIVIEIKEESEKVPNELVSSNASATAQTSQDPVCPANAPGIKGGTAKTMTPAKDSDVEIVCEEISSDEAMFNEADDGEPELIEPVIESIVISSDSEPEKPEEKQESWKERWMQKKDISSVLKASKLITNVKRKMKRDKTDKIALAQAAQEAQVKPQQIMLAIPPTVIQGTVSEFNLLPPATTSLASVVEQSLAEEPATKQTPAEHSVTEHITAEQPVAGQVNNGHQIEEQIPIQQLTTEIPQTLQLIKQPIEQCINEQVITNIIQGTRHETETTAVAQEEVETSKPSAASSPPSATIVEEPKTVQAAALQLSNYVKWKEDSVDDFQETSVHSSAVDQLSAELPHVTQSVTEQPVDEKGLKPVKRKKSKKGDKTVKSKVQKVPAESSLAIKVSEKQSNEVTPQMNPPEAVAVIQYTSRKEVKKAKREKKSKGDKMKRRHVKKMQSAVSKVLIGGTSSPTTPNVSPRKQCETNESIVKLVVTEPSGD